MIVAITTQGNSRASHDIGILPVADGRFLYTSGLRFSKIEFVQRRNDDSLAELAGKVLEGFFDSRHAMLERFEQFLLVYLKLAYDFDPKNGEWFAMYACALLFHLLDERKLPDMEHVGQLLVKTTLSEDEHKSDSGHSQEISADEKRKALQTLIEKFGLNSNGEVVHALWNKLFEYGILSTDGKSLSVEQYDKFVELAQENLMFVQLRDKHHTDLNHTYFRTENGHMGLFSGKVIPGDMVCIIFGCDMPVILRMIDGKYVHLGVSYVVGLMRGEAVEEMENGKLVVEKFVIS